MIKTIIDVLLSILLGGLFALVLVLACPMGAEGESWFEAVCSRLKRGWSHLCRTEIRLLGIGLAVGSYILLLAFPGLVLASWTAFWLLVLYAPMVLFELADKAKVRIREMGEKKITATERK